MPTNADFLAQGHSQADINQAVVAKNEAAIGEKLGQDYNATTGQFAKPETNGVQASASVASTDVNNAAKSVAPIPLPTESPKPTSTVVTDGVNSFDTATKQQVGTKTVGGETVAPAVTPAPQTNVEKTTVATPEGQTVTTKETPPAPVVDYNVGKGRETEINQHLQEGLAQSATTQKAIQTGDIASFRKAYGYDTADSTKKQLLDNFYEANTPKTSQSFFDILATGGSIPKNQYVSNPQAAEAQHMYDILSPYKNASPEVLSTAMINGKLAPGSDAYNDLVKLNGGIETAAMQQAKVLTQNKLNTDNINRTTSIISGTDKPETPPTDKISSNLLTEKGIDYGEEFKKAVSSNPEIVDLATQVNTTSQKINELEAAKKQTMREIATAHPGLSTSLLYSLVDSQNAPLDVQITQLQNDRAFQSSQLDYKTTLAQKGFDYTKQQQEATLAYERQKAITQQGQQFQTLQQTRQYALQNGDVNSTDKTIRQTGVQKAVDEVYKTYGPLMTTSSAQHTQDILALMDKGMSFADAIRQNLTDPLQAKDEFADFKTAITNKAEGAKYVQNYNGDWVNQYTGEKKVDEDARKASQNAPTRIAYSPEQDANLMSIRQNSNGETVYSDKTTGKEITASEAQKLYGNGVSTLSGASNYQKMTAATNPVGVYSSSDPTGANHAAVYNAVDKQGLDASLSSVNGNPITKDMIISSASKFGIDPIALAATLKLDSNYGTAGLGSKNFNPGNVGQFDRLGITANKGYGSWQEGVDGAAENLAKRQEALQPKQQTPTNAVGTTGTGTVDTSSEGYFSKPIASAGGLTQSAIDAAAQVVNAGGTNPYKGQRGPGLQKNDAVANRAAELLAGGNVIANKANAKALSSSLSTQTGYANTVERAYNTANDSLQVLTSLVKKAGINSSTTPAINDIENKVKAGLLQPGDLAAFKSSLATIRSEYSQVLAKGGVRSVETDNKANSLIPDNLSPADLQKVTDQLNADAQISIGDARKQVKDIQDQLNGKTTTDVAPTQSSPTGNTIKASNGKTYTY